MTLGILPTKLGTAGGVDIIANVDSHSLATQSLVRVSLSSDYARNPPPGFLLGGTPAGTVPIGANPTVTPKTIAAGTVATFAACEAAALIAAGAATAV